MTDGASLSPPTSDGCDAKKEAPDSGVNRRAFLRTFGLAAPVLLGVVKGPAKLLGQESGGEGEGDLLYAMGIDPAKCIGCARCVVACKTENDVPDESHFFNTWIERYVIQADGEVAVDSPNGGIDGWPGIGPEANVMRTFFVPKLCNHCEKAPCVQVCPVGATYTSPDGVVLVDEGYCIGCRYCVQACPYGARWIHPEEHVAAKCTFCFHRLGEGLLPACVEVCPTEARLFGELGNRANPLERFRRFNNIQVLKGHLNTEPKVFYANLDGEVR
ncbi:MAG: 4Fe-4S dicluster domain-containing protein [Gemmatimonadetes bacterium]|nr:4Fe-4S dicluster domain-containing protein [Gemmatimonadota bacterium]